MHVFAIFVGSGRSGTTLFRNVFDSHSELAMAHEAHFVAPLARRRKAYETATGLDADALVADLFHDPNFVRQGLDRAAVRSALDVSGAETYADAVRTVFSLYAAKHGKARYGDKTPGYVIQLDLLGRLFPEARFVHIIRDGRDVAMAYLDRDEWGPSTMADAAQYWRSRVGRGRRVGSKLGPERYREVRYEDMVEDPEGVTRELCAFLDLEFEAEMLDFYRRGSEFAAGTKHPDAFENLSKPITKGMRDWRIQMAPDDVALFEAIAGDLLADCGYEVTGTGRGFGLRARALWASTVWQAKRIGARLAPLMSKVRRSAGESVSSDA